MLEQSTRFLEQKRSELLLRLWVHDEEALGVNTFLNTVTKTARHHSKTLSSGNSRQIKRGRQIWVAAVIASFSRETAVIRGIAKSIVKER